MKEVEAETLELDGFVTYTCPFCVYYPNGKYNSYGKKTIAVPDPHGAWSYHQLSFIPTHCYPSVPCKEPFLVKITEKTKRLNFRYPHNW